MSNEIADKIRNVKRLLDEKEKYEDALNVLNNYDSKFSITISSLHNDNAKVLKEVKIPFKVINEPPIKPNQYETNKEYLRLSIKRKIDDIVTELEGYLK